MVARHLTLPTIAVDLERRQLSLVFDDLTVTRCE